MKVYVIGVGMGDAGTLTQKARQAIEESELIIGAKRLVEPYRERDIEVLELIRPSDIADVLDQAQAKTACVLFSGDIGFYSGATGLYDKLQKHDVEAIPGISSLVYFCAQIHTTWQDAALVSAHGREHDAVGAIQQSAKTFCITGGKTKVEDICRDLVERGWGDVRVTAGEHLSYDYERIVSGTARELAEQTFADLAVMLAENPHPIKRACAAPSLADGDFLRGKAPMTKEEVRALVISKLHLAPDHTVWDVGAGTGSVSVEAALAVPRGRVFAIEKSTDAIELLYRNREQHGAWNMTVVEGAAPAALEGLVAPDRVFVGGSTGSMDAIVDRAIRANPHVRVCATAITLETLTDLLSCLRDRGVENADIVQVSVARADKVGSYHLMRAENPVYIVTAEFDEVVD